MPVLRNIGFLATCRAQGPQGEVHPIPRAALAWEGDTIAWVGPEAELPARYASLPAEDAGGRLVIPLGRPGEQRLLLIRRRSQSEYSREDLGPVAFVPFVKD